jgi:hypothetical protein
MFIEPAIVRRNLAPLGATCQSPRQSHRYHRHVAPMGLLGLWELAGFYKHVVPNGTGNLYQKKNKQSLVSRSGRCIAPIYRGSTRQGVNNHVE